jgi:CRISPR/Cas system CSM-associated protein Csm3 (group 7 of RAMP superfamily)
VIDALDLVEKDYLGGSGSRGYGQVQFYIETTPEAKKRPYEILQLKQNDFEKIFQWQTISTN